ncbi:MAG: phage protein NinX family protein [Pseudomonas sp.]
MNKMIEVKTADLIGLALDWATGVADGRELELPGAFKGRTSVVWCDPFVIRREGHPEFHDKTRRKWEPSTNGGQSMELIIKYQIAIISEAHDGLEGTEMSDRWYADVYYGGGQQYTTEHCNTALVAACRAIVGTVFGDTVSVPAELI